MEDLATYILNEKDYIQKMIITYYLSRKTGIFFDKSIALRVQIARMFINYAMLDVDENIVLTEMLLCNCKKIDNPQKIGRLETYAKEGAEYLSTLGFDKKFCKTCEEVNRYSESQPREKESDILEVVDQFTGLILDRPERAAFQPDEALVILRDRNLRDVENRYLNEFIKFVNDMERVYIRESVEVPVIRRLVFIHNNEEDVKTFIKTLGNKYSETIDEIINNKIDTEILERNKEEGTRIIKRYIKIEENKQRAMFSQEIAEKVLNHESKYRIEDEKKEGE